MINNQMNMIDTGDILTDIRTLIPRTGSDVLYTARKLAHLYQLQDDIIQAGGKCKPGTFIINNDYFSTFVRSEYTNINEDFDIWLYQFIDWDRVESHLLHNKYNTIYYDGVKYYVGTNKTIK